MSGAGPRRWVLECVLALLASLALLAGGALWLHERGVAEAPAPVVLVAAELQPSGPFARATSAGITIEGVPAGGRATALAAALRLDGEGFGSASVEVRGHRPHDKLLLLWSAAAAPDTLLGTPLAWSGGDTLNARLEGRPHWQGAVTALGVGVSGPLAGPLTIRRLSLEPRSPAAWLASVWREWTAFEGLDAHSSNFVIGGSDQARPLWRPVPAAAGWVGLALVLHALARGWRRRWPDRRVCAGVVLAGWVALDARWQLDLWRQLEATRERYAGKSWLEKRTLAEDGDLFRFALELKARLPRTPQVVYLLTRAPDAADRYLQLRARYHLLPHNVCGYYSVPPREAVPGEYLVVFGSRDDLVYDAGARILRSEADGRETPVEPVLSDRLATVYRRR